MAINSERVIGMNQRNKLQSLLGPHKFMLPKTNTFFGFIQLQQGVIILGCFFVVSAVSSLLTNMFLFSQVFPFGCILIYIFNIYELYTWRLAILGAIGGKLFDLKRALILWTVFIIMWIFVVVCSTFNHGITLMCLDCRCPESFWMYNNTWHDNTDPMPAIRPTSPKDYVFEPFADKPNAEFLSPEFELKSPPSLLATFIRLAGEDDSTTKSGKKKETIPPMDIDIKNEHDDDTYYQQQIHSLNFLLFLGMILMHLIILLYSWYIVFCFYSELHCFQTCMCAEYDAGHKNPSK